MFIATLISVFFTIHLETLFLVLQIKDKKMEKWLGVNAFKFHASVISAMWIITFILITIFQFEPHPLFHDIQYIKYIGMFLMIAGIIIAVWGFAIMGYKKTLCINFYKEDTDIVKAKLYEYLKNPQDYGLWIALLGFSLYSGSLYNLIIAFEFIIVMIPHIYVENVPLRNNKWPD